MCAIKILGTRLDQKNNLIREIAEKLIDLRDTAIYIEGSNSVEVFKLLTQLKILLTQNEYQKLSNGFSSFRIGTLSSDKFESICSDLIKTYE